MQLSKESFSSIQLNKSEKYINTKYNSLKYLFSMTDKLKCTRFANVMQSLILETIFSVILAAGDLKKNKRDASVLFLNSHLIIEM